VTGVGERPAGAVREAIRVSRYPCGLCPRSRCVPVLLSQSLKRTHPFYCLTGSKSDPRPDPRGSQLPPAEEGSRIEMVT
jgi:hypothetical protein